MLTTRNKSNFDNRRHGYCFNDLLNTLCFFDSPGTSVGYVEHIVKMLSTSDGYHDSGGGYHNLCGGYREYIRVWSLYRGDTMMHLGDIMIHVEDIMSHAEDIMSTSGFSI